MRFFRKWLKYAVQRMCVYTGCTPKAKKELTFNMEKMMEVVGSCLWCGRDVSIRFGTPMYVLSFPQMACGEDCLNKYEASTLAWLEKNDMKPEFTD